MLKERVERVSEKILELRKQEDHEGLLTLSESFDLERKALQALQNATIDSEDAVYWIKTREEKPDSSWIKRLDRDAQKNLKEAKKLAKELEELGE